MLTPKEIGDLFNVWGPRFEQAISPYMAQERHAILEEFRAIIDAPNDWKPTAEEALSMYETVGYLFVFREMCREEGFRPDLDLTEANLEANAVLFHNATCCAMVQLIDECK